MAYREGAAGLLSENQRIRGLISSVIDIMLLIAAYLLANFLRFNWLPFFEEGGAGPALDIARSPMVALGWAGYAVVMVLLYWSRGLYNPSRLRGLWQRRATPASRAAGRPALRFRPLLHPAQCGQFHRSGPRRCSAGRCAAKAESATHWSVPTATEE